jgi:hypothetical protein
MLAGNGSPEFHTTHSVVKLTSRLTLTRRQRLHAWLEALLLQHQKLISDSAISIPSSA